MALASAEDFFKAVGILSGVFVPFEQLRFILLFLVLVAVTIGGVVFLKTLVFQKT